MRDKRCGTNTVDEVIIRGNAAPHEVELINSQRRHYFGIMRNLMDTQAGMDRATPTARLLVEGAVLHLQTDLDWPERCQEELI